LAIKIWKARVGDPVLPDAKGALTQGALPGTVLVASAQAISVACGPQGNEVIDLLELQRPGGRRLSAREWLSGFALHAGERWQGLDSAAVTPTSP
jgi:methionyl-tRNA formyltransferase